MVHSKTIFDSCVWLALFMPEDTQHKKAVTLFTETTEAILIPEYVLLEVSSILRSKKFTDRAIVFCRDTINDTKNFLHSMPLVGETVETFCKCSDKLSFVDTALLVLSKDYNVVTFDKNLAKAIKSYK